MATYKTCQKCQQIVQWAPDPVVRVPNAAMYPWLCAGGNTPQYCKLSNDKAADQVAAEQEVGA